MDNLYKIKEFFNEIASTWDDTKADSSGAEKIVNQFSEQINNRSILDIGCGTGVLYEFLKKAGAKDITGIDLSEKMIRIAKEKFPKANFKVSNILEWNSKEKYDTIIMYNVYPHLTNKQKLVDKVHSLLNEGGIFIVAHGASKETINSHHSSHAMEISRKLLKAEEEAEIWRSKFDVNIIRDNELYYFSGKLI